MDIEEHDSTAVDTRASVMSSERGNVSSTSSNSGDNQLSAKDIANWREFWDVWANHHRISTTSIQSLILDQPQSQDIHGVFQFAYHIPRSWFCFNATEQSPLFDRLRKFLVDITEADPVFLGENETAVPARMESEHSLALAATALQINEAARRLAYDHFISDEQWAVELHDALIVQCARGRLLYASESWPLPNQHLAYFNPSPTIRRILNVRKIRPRGAIPIPLRDDISCPEPSHSNTTVLFAASFATRLQITSPLHDIPELIALHAFNTMATSTVLSQFSILGIDMPVFGVLFDRNVVRFHVDWSMDIRDSECRDIVSLPLPQAGQSSTPSHFKDFDLTRPDDALRVVFILDAIHSFAETRLAPVVGSRLWDLQRNHSKLPLAQDEITSEEKVQAWMQSGAVDAVGPPDL